MGTMNLPIALSRNSVLRMRTNAMVVEISRLSVLASCALKAESSGTSSAFEVRRRCGKEPPSCARRSRRYFISGLSSGGVRNGISSIFSSGTGMAEAVAEFAQGFEPHLLLLMGDVLAFAGLAHAVSLHGLGENDRRLAGMLHGGGIRGIDLDRIGAAAPQRPDLIVAPVLHQLGGLGIFAEEMLAHIGAVLRLEILIFAVDAFLHALAQHAGSVFGEQRIPAPIPTAP